MTKSTARSFRHRKTARTAIVFIHGFTGHKETTWGLFPHFLQTEPCLKKWDIWSVGFSTSLYPELRGIWSADPGIEKLALALRTRCSHGDLSTYDRLIFIAHSMGGLVVQQAIVGDATLSSRVDALFFFGVPTLGLVKARIFSFLKLQVRDMRRDGPFVSGLRRKWTEAYPNNSEPFQLYVVAGERDEFVPESSSLEGFAEAQRHCVPGGHISMVKPESKSDECVQLVVRAICSRAAVASGWTSEQAAIERGEFHKAIRTMLPKAKNEELTQEALVDLALALDATGKRRTAIEVLEDHPKLGTDALGVLGGRYKREWLLGGTEKDAVRAHELYSRALAQSQENNDDGQVFYHAVNLAFLELTHFKRRGACKRFAELALEACQRAAPKNYWNLATQGEARLYLDDLDGALKSYRAALRLKPKLREIESTYMQARIAAERALGEQPAELTRLFGKAGF